MKTPSPVDPRALTLQGVQEHPKQVQPRRLTLAERFYLPLLAAWRSPSATWS